MLETILILTAIIIATSSLIIIICKDQKSVKPHIYDTEVLEEIQKVKSLLYEVIHRYNDNDHELTKIAHNLIDALERNVLKA